MSFQKKKILVCPLDWGLGHAVRDVPIINRLSELGHEVVIAGDGAALELLRAEFPELTAIRFRTGFRIRYSLFLPAWFKITLLSPLLLYEIIAEHFRLSSLIDKINPDIIISDNRYGLWSRKVRSILITHQLNIRVPGYLRIFEYPVFLVLRAFINRFDQCWIPDYPGDQNLSGELSHLSSPSGDLSSRKARSGSISRRFARSQPRNAEFIGPLSRFSVVSAADKHHSEQGTSVDLLILLSGPEPQRSRLEKIVLNQVHSLKSNSVLLQGLPGNSGGTPGNSKRTDLPSTVSMYSHLHSSELQKLLISAGAVICQAGYTGIMDLARMQKKALIIPTPGQTEQEYLSQYLSEKGMFLKCNQEELNLESAIADLSEFRPVFSLPPDDLLDDVLAGV